MTTRQVPRGPAAATWRRLVVPWHTVLPLAIVMAYADGFWIQSLRGSVGAIERNQTPFVSWLRESTLVLPIFVFAVLGALTVALRSFGPDLTAKTRAVTALLVVGCGTLAGVVVLVASSAFDYHLQTQMLRAMGTMSGSCLGGCQARLADATLGLQERAVLYGSGFLLVTNVVSVGWVWLWRGGRLRVATGYRRGTFVDVTRSRARDLRLLLVASLVGAAVVHAAVVDEHLSEWRPAGVFFVVLTVGQVVLAGLVLQSPRPPVLWVVSLGSAGLLVLWVWSRTIGMPIGPEAGAPEAIWLADGSASLLEVLSLGTAIGLMRGPRRPQGPPASEHVFRLAVVAVVAVTTLGLGGSGLVLFDVGSPASMSTTTTPG